jgi:hypothetical protein
MLSYTILCFSVGSLAFMQTVPIELSLTLLAASSANVARMHHVVARLRIKYSPVYNKMKDIIEK